MKLSYSLVLIFISLNFQSFASAASLEITSLNIKWFGRGGNLHGNLEDEYRSDFIKDYINTYLPDSDVYVFQEITDKEGLYSIMSGFECFSYDTNSGRHQFVVMCSKPGLLQTYEINHNVQLGRWGLRAAVVGNYKIGEDLIKVIGVHLKAGTKDTEVRLNQIEALKESYQKNEESPLQETEESLNENVVLIGDFNTYKTPRTNLELDDSILISQSLGKDFDLVENETSTYMGFGGRVFDRAWIKNFEASKASVVGPCKVGSVDVPYSDRSYYRDFVSDHCALKVNLNL